MKSFWKWGAPLLGLMLLHPVLLFVWMISGVAHPVLLRGFSFGWLILMLVTAGGAARMLPSASCSARQAGGMNQAVQGVSLLALLEYFILLVMCGFASDTPSGAAMVLPVFFSLGWSTLATWICCGILNLGCARALICHGAMKASDAEFAAYAGFFFPHIAALVLLSRAERHMRELFVQAIEAEREKTSHP